MTTPSDEPLYSGLPMELDELSPEASLPYPLPEGALVVTIEDARASLPEASNVLMVLQAMSDEAHDLTNELELLLDRFPMTHPHVIEVAEHLGQLVTSGKPASPDWKPSVPASFPWTPADSNGTAWSTTAWPCFHGRSVRPISSGITGWKRAFLPANPS